MLIRHLPNQYYQISAKSCQDKNHRKKPILSRTRLDFDDLDDYDEFAEFNDFYNIDVLKIC